MLASDGTAKPQRVWTAPHPGPRGIGELEPPVSDPQLDVVDSSAPQAVTAVEPGVQETRKFRGLASSDWHLRSDGREWSDELWPPKPNKPVWFNSLEQKRRCKNSHIWGLKNNQESGD